VVMTTSALLRHGPDHVTALLDGLTAWMDRKEIGSVGEIRGLLAPSADTPQRGFGRYGYLRAVEQATRAYSPSPW
jgi:dihydroorotate dehydrogenase (fumarate)